MTVKLTSKGVSAPQLETERLTLRAHDTGDFPACFQMWSYPEVTRFIGGVPSTEQQTWSRILNYAGHWKLLGFGYWAVFEKTSGSFVGEIGFADFHRPLEEAWRDLPELGWALTPAFHGIGLAGEAVREVLRWGDENFVYSDSFCMIQKENVRSIRVAEKNGFQFSNEAVIATKAVNLYLRKHASIRPRELS